MKKNISLAHSLLLLPLIAPSVLLSMENDDKKFSIEESRIIIPEPKKRGLGIIRSSFDLIWSEEENLYNDLRTKTFDVDNSSYHRKLDTAVEIFVEKENSDRLAEIFTLCRTNYPKQIKIGDGQAIMAHKFLVEKNKKEQAITKEKIQKVDKLYLDKENELLAETKKVLASMITSMQTVYTEYAKEHNTLVSDKCNDIRKIKKASINLHKLNKTFELSRNEIDGYCSDDESDIKNPENINNSYSNANLLKKIDIAEKTEQTNEKIKELLYCINVLVSRLNEIQPLQY